MERIINFAVNTALNIAYKNIYLIKFLWIFYFGIFREKYYRFLSREKNGNN